MDKMTANEARNEKTVASIGLPVCKKWYSI